MATERVMHHKRRPRETNFTPRRSTLVVEAAFYCCHRPVTLVCLHMSFLRVSYLIIFQLLSFLSFWCQSSPSPSLPPFCLPRSQLRASLHWSHTDALLISFLSDSVLTAASSRFFSLSCFSAAAQLPSFHLPPLSFCGCIASAAAAAAADPPQILLSCVP